MHRTLLSPPLPLAILAMALLGMPLARAKRLAPPVVSEIVTPAAIYSAPNHFFYPGSSSSRAHGGITQHTTGLVEARRPGTGELLWQKTAYTIDYVPRMESDIQDVWVKHLSLDKGRGLLLVTDERHWVHALDLTTLEVTRATASGSGELSVRHRGTDLRIRIDPESSTPAAILDAVTGERTQLRLGTASTNPIQTEPMPSPASPPAASSSPQWGSIALVFSVLGALYFVFERRHRRLPQYYL